ncbi:MAG TPA: hypothetical protein PK794_13805, partial [Armatimonadota bacterium]|nr:hypothetical protein [Armatimonadota bacterium]
DRLAERYCAVSRRALTEQGAELAAISDCPADRVALVLARTEGLGARQALREVLMTYAPGHAVAESMDWYGQVGGVFSAGTLEHYPPFALEAEVARMALALRPGGVMSHVVDHRDHRWHADKRLCPLAHLTLDDDAYARRFATPLDYHNRWLMHRYVDLFTRYGFHVTVRTAIAYPPDLPPLDRSRLAPPFRDATEEELGSLVTHFVAVKR